MSCIRLTLRTQCHAAPVPSSTGLDTNSMMSLYARLDSHIIFACCFVGTAINHTVFRRPRVVRHRFHFVLPSASTCPASRRSLPRNDRGSLEPSVGLPRFTFYRLDCVLQLGRCAELLCISCSQVSVRAQRCRVLLHRSWATVGARRVPGRCQAVGVVESYALSEAGAGGSSGLQGVSDF